VFGRAGDPRAASFCSMPTFAAGGRPDQKRRFALAVIGELGRVFDVPRSAVYVIFTEHEGPEFQMHDGVLPSWSAGEDPLEDLG